LSGFVSALLVTSCGDDSKNPSPAPSTAGDGGDNATAGSGPSGGDNTTDPAAGGGAGAPAPQDVLLGSHCQRDADCGAGLHCLGADRDYPGGTGAPPAGLCTTDCEKDADCRGFDATAVCATLDEVPIMLSAVEEPARRLCLQGCSFGAPAGADKCHGQLDMACRPFAPTPLVTCFQQDDVCPDGTFCFRGACREAACGPRCNTDADCALGRSCNASTGLCDAAPQQPVPIGADCPGDQDPESTVCGNGTCLLLSADGLSVKRFCTQTCTIGTLCGDEGACVLPRLQDYAAGDIGYCMERCNCDADCQHPDDRCYEWSTPGLAAHFKSRGVCDTGDPADETLSSCEGEGGAGGGGSVAGNSSGGQTAGGETSGAGQGGQGG
jgi:hypothetical protein